ncbi:MAG: hypothetical protein LBD28_05710 [Tannerellaceae bacterium]|jgi:hypothetical protein|nr:hypothetical protein [Tannerellaceae bacterium]
MATKPSAKWDFISSQYLLLGILIPPKYQPKYNTSDIAVINRFIGHRMQYLKKAPEDGSFVPKSWKGVGWSSDELNKRIRSLDYFSPSKRLDVSELKFLEFLNCSYNDLSELNVSGLSRLKKIICCRNSIPELDLSGLIRLESLKCTENFITELKVSELSKLKFINCHNNSLTKLDVSGLSELKKLDCHSNCLTALDLSSLPSLTNFCGLLQHSSLTMTWNPAKEQYEGAIALNQPSELDEALRYSDGKLIAATDSLASTPFAVETGLEGKQLSGAIDLTYTK